MLSQATSLKKMDSLFSSIPWLPIDPQLGIGLYEPFPIRVGIWLGLILSRSHARSHSHCEFMSATVLSCLTNILLLWTSTALGPSYTSSFMVPEPWGEGCITDVPFRVGHATVPYSLKAEQLKGYVLLPIRFKKKLSWWGLKDTLMRIKITQGMFCYYVHLTE